MVRALFGEAAAAKVLAALASDDIGLDLERPEDVLLLDNDMLGSCAILGNMQRKKLIEAVAALAANAD